MKSKIEKILEERITSSHESSLRSLHACGSYSSRSSFSSSIGSKNLCSFHGKHIFDEDTNARYALADLRHTFERTFTLLGDSYEVIL